MMIAAGSTSTLLGQSKVQFNAIVEINVQTLVHAVKRLYTCSKTFSPWAILNILH